MLLECNIISRRTTTRTGMITGKLVPAVKYHPMKKWGWG
jgi:hypothetical protein